MAILHPHEYEVEEWGGYDMELLDREAEVRAFLAEQRRRRLSKNKGRRLSDKEERKE